MYVYNHRAIIDFSPLAVLRSLWSQVYSCRLIILLNKVSTCRSLGYQFKNQQQLMNSLCLCTFESATNLRTTPLRNEYTWQSTLSFLVLFSFVM